MDKYVVEYSVSQGAFHVDTLERILEINRDLCVSGVLSDYKIVGIFQSYEEAIRFSECLEPVFGKSQTQRNVTEALYRGMAQSSFEELWSEGSSHEQNS